MAPMGGRDQRRAAACEGGHDRDAFGDHFRGDGPSGQELARNVRSPFAREMCEVYDDGDFRCLRTWGVSASVREAQDGGSAPWKVRDTAAVG